MKIYISADIEGISSISTWQESDMKAPSEACARMTREVCAACEAAIEMGATEVLVKDAHGYGKNICHEDLPTQVKLMSGWANHPYNMVEGIDESYEGVVFLGYHSAASTPDSPLSHTLDTRLAKVTLNGEIASEFLIYHTLTNSLNVPTLLVTGDGGIVREVSELDPNIEAVAVKEGFAGAMISNHPAMACKEIKEALKRGISKRDSIEMPMIDEFTLEVTFKEHKEAYKYSFFPHATQVNSHTIKIQSENYQDILTFLLFI
ncbi:M55 family metallopeptidase [Candidatus Epulonipiscium viviparus]|uniref:M55 family metallopeptidase n=1 Tax=Candidatus Epulonipiscium viviparus TaxID=420336 RepID=UPI00016C0336|nr:M55 family metallopeptidase [Candidatus Epulopiscium viviparus]